MTTANIIGWDNGGGLSRDIDVLVNVLSELGWNVLYGGRSRRRRQTYADRRYASVYPWLYSQAIRARFTKAPYDINIHLENVYSASISMARVNVLIPNPEWLSEESRMHLRALDGILVKTRHAEEVFSGLGAPVHRIGWTACDRHLDCGEHPMGLGSALHVAGANPYKGTETVLGLWYTHPEWPDLHVVRARCDYAGTTIPWKERPCAHNVFYEPWPLTDAELQRLQNQHRVHICVSESEGYGHTLAEGLSTGALVVTTDAPPMNELVTAERGRLVLPSACKPVRMGARYDVDQYALERCLTEVFAMDSSAFQQVALSARTWYLENKVEFKARIARALLDVV